MDKKKEEFPDAKFIVITRFNEHILSPSWDLLNRYKRNNDWDAFCEDFKQEMSNWLCRVQMLAIAKEAKEHDVFLVCYENDEKCHRFLVKEIIEDMMKFL